MKLLCDSCGQVVPLTQLRQEAGALVFACAQCGAQGRIETDSSPGQETAPTGQGAQVGPAGQVEPTRRVGPPREAPQLTVVTGTPGPVPTFDAPADHCPKCIEPHATSALICARCGLVFANFTPELVKVRPQLAEKWSELHAHWDDPAAHEKLIRLAEGWGGLAELGRLYRIRLAIDPKDARAAAGRERIISLAAGIVLPHTPKPESPRTFRTIGYAMIGVLVLALLGLFFRMVSR